MIVVAPDPVTTRWEKRGSCNGCGWCLDPVTLVLTTTGTWRPISEIQVGDRVVGFDEHAAPGRHRRLRDAVVMARAERSVPAHRIVTTEGEVIASPDHPWLVRTRSRNRQWRATRELRSGMDLISLAEPLVAPGVGAPYRQGYLGGVSAGDAMVGHWRAASGFAHHGYRLAMVDRNAPILARAKEYAAAEGISLRARTHSAREPLRALETWKAEEIGRIEHWMTDRGRPLDFERGFLAGLFDAEGSCHVTLRLTNTNRGLLDRAAECLTAFKFSSVIGGPQQRGEARRPIWDLRLLGGVREILRFFAVMQPQADWKAPLRNRRADGRSAQILAVEPVGSRRLVDLTTTTCTFVAAGLLTHNCCQFIGRRTMTFTGKSDDYDRPYLELRGATMNGDRVGTATIGVFLPCTAHDNTAKRCTVYAKRPRTCQDFPWEPVQVQGIPCSFFFTRQVNGRTEVIAGDGAPADEVAAAMAAP